MKTTLETGDFIRVLIVPGLLLDGELIRLDYDKPVCVIRATNEAGTVFHIRQWIEIHIIEKEQTEPEPSLRIVT